MPSDKTSIIRDIMKPFDIQISARNKNSENRETQNESICYTDLPFKLREDH